MKKVIIIALSLAALNVAAQDIIVMRNGDEVEAKVTKVGTTEVEYHKWSNQDGPVYTVAKSDVFMVKYKNGEKDVFDNVTAKSDNSPKSESNSSAPQYVEAVPAANNQELISIYNKEVDFVAIKNGLPEYNKTMYIEEFMRQQIQNQLNYTAITRAKKYLIYIKKTNKYFQLPGITVPTK